MDTRFVVAQSTCTASGAHAIAWNVLGFVVDLATHSNAKSGTKGCLT